MSIERRGGMFNVDEQLPASCPRDASLPALWMVTEKPTEPWTPKHEPFVIGGVTQMAGGGGATSNGAFKVNVTSSSVADTYDLVIKSSSGGLDSAAGEEVASRLALALDLVTTPVRALPSKSAVVHSLLLRCQFAQIDGEGDLRYLQGIIAGSVPKRSHVLVQGFLQHDCSLSELTQDLHEASLWRQLGAICALDALLNNFDRLPFVHRNDGNTTNILVKNDAEGARVLMPIDQQLFVVAGAALTKYATTLENMCDDVDQWDEGLTRVAGALGVADAVDSACRDSFRDSFMRVLDRFCVVDLESLTARLDESLATEVPRIRDFLRAMQACVMQWRRQP